MKQTFIGLVISAAAQKTVKVCVPSTKIHKLVKKEIVVRKNYAVHDENEVCGVGDVVRIEPCRRVSKTKHFCVAEIIRAAPKYTDPVTGVTIR